MMIAAPIDSMDLIGGVELAEGDYLFTQPGEEHEVVALTEAVIFVSSQKSTTVVE